MPKAQLGKIHTSLSDQQERVHRVFSQVRHCYDRMNDVMSFGMHRLWKRSFVVHLPVLPHQRVLDLSCGTGDIAIALYKHFAALHLMIELCDPNEGMLEEAWRRVVDECHWFDARFVCARAEALPYADMSFHGVTCAFGVRNMGDRMQGLCEIYRILRCGGWFYMMEFHPPDGFISSRYIQRVVPLLGRWVAGDQQAYTYLADSIATFPCRREWMQQMEKAGFSDVDYRKVGPVTIYWGQRCS